MDVRIDKEKLGDVIRYVEAEVDFEELAQAASELRRLIAGNPFENYLKFRATVEEMTELLGRVFLSLEEGAQMVKAADPETDTGALKLEAATQILDQAIVFEGVFGTLVAERFDDDAIRFILTAFVGLMNKGLGSDWAKGLVEPEAA